MGASIDGGGGRGGGGERARPPGKAKLQIDARSERATREKKSNTSDSEGRREAGGIASEKGL
jgi:hypothetical protein